MKQPISYNSATYKPYHYYPPHTLIQMPKQYLKRILFAIAVAAVCALIAAVFAQDISWIMKDLQSL